MSQCWVGRTFKLKWPYHRNEFWHYSFLENSIPVHIRQIREGLDILQLRKTFLGIQLKQLQELKGRDETFPTGHTFCGAWLRTQGARDTASVLTFGPVPLLLCLRLPSPGCVTGSQALPLFVPIFKNYFYLHCRSSQ